MADEVKRKILAAFFILVVFAELGVWIYFQAMNPHRLGWKDVAIFVASVGAIAGAIYIWRYQPPG